MSFSLESIGMEKGARYEAIYTTMNKNGKMNAAPIGVKCINDYDVAARLFEGSRTLSNIKETNLFVVNITDNPKIYADALYGNLENLEFVRDDDIAYLKNVDAYFICLVKSINEVEAQKDYVNEGAKSFIVTAENIKIVINKQGAKALNRGLFSFLESLVDYTRVDVIDNEKKEEYKKRFLENERVIERVAESDVKEAMATLREKMIEKGLDI
ncbi:DUF447 domain-containing protein [Methanobrevibacter sp.]|uniref:DUF447 domain-containing protein n=1 Tax=Methanobrevibacter sp. TaxID=66852 RepID=UPI00388DE615